MKTPLNRIPAFDPVDDKSEGDDENFEFWPENESEIEEDERSPKDGIVFWPEDEPDNDTKSPDWSTLVKRWAEQKNNA